MKTKWIIVIAAVAIAVGAGFALTLANQSDNSNMETLILQPLGAGDNTGPKTMFA